MTWGDLFSTILKDQQLICIFLIKVSIVVGGSNFEAHYSPAYSLTNNQANTNHSDTLIQQTWENTKIQNLNVSTFIISLEDLI